MKINPRIDLAFKKLFGSEENKDLLLSLINAILQLAEPLTELTLKNPYNLADYLAGKLSVLDIKAKDQLERWFNVEMQISESHDYDKRALFYWCKLLTEQLNSGDLYKQINKTFSINILAFDFINTTPSFHNRYRILNVESCKDDNKHLPLEFHYIELLKFHKEYNELSTALDRWITFLNRAHELDRRYLPETLAQDKTITKAISVAERLFDDTERKLYEIRLLAITDEASRIDSAHEKGIFEGKLEGQRALLKKLIIRRFGELPTWVEERINIANDTQLELWAETIFDVEHIEQLFK